MKKTAFTLLLIVCAVQLVTAQKIYLNYKLKTADTTYQIKGNALSDELIQKKSDTLFAIIKADKKVISIEDNTNRKFERIIFRDAVYYPKVLNEGHFRMYELKLKDNPTYIVYSGKDTVVIEKKDSLVDNIVMKDRNYNNRLVYLSRDYPELWKEAVRVEFRKSNLQHYISLLNSKYGDQNIIRKEKNKVRFVTFALKDGISAVGNQISIGALINVYALDLSSDLSFRYGLRANYSDYFKSIEIPLQLHYESTNATSTPFITLGLMRIIASKQSHYDFPWNKMSMDVAAGWKLKMNSGINVVADINFSTYRSWTFDMVTRATLGLGVEYSLKL